MIDDMTGQRHRSPGNDRTEQLLVRKWQQRRRFMTVEALLAEKELDVADEDASEVGRTPVDFRACDALLTIALTILLLLGAAWLGGLL